MVEAPAPLAVVSLGTVPYLEAWDLQRRLVQLRRSGQVPDVLLVLEHPHTYTVGKSGREEHVLWPAAERERRGIQVVHVDRGGDVTYHGPGQLVAYPIVDLTRLGRDVHRYLRSLEGAVVEVLGELGVVARAGEPPRYTGVWVGEEKVCAIGIKVSHGVTSHGLALNVDPDLAYFAGIVPCGIREKGVTSLARVLGRPLSRPEVEPHVVGALARWLGCRAVPSRLQELVPSA